MRKSNNQKIYALLITTVTVLSGISIAAFFSQNFSACPSKIAAESTITTQPQPQRSISSVSSVVMSVPAVDNEGKGVAVSLSVEARSGSGRVLTNIDKLLFWVDTQQSIQIAKNVAENLTGVSASSIDLIYAIDSNATIIGGPSAGAALAVATIAVLEGKTINNSVMITGTINPDGSIGQVGGILEKAEAARATAKLFLVPESQGTQTVLKPEEKCIQKPNFIYCETKYTTRTVDISESAGIAVKEVSNIREAVKYFYVQSALV